MKIKITIKNGINIMSISGPIKSGMEFDFADTMETLSGNKNIINLKECPFVNAAALGILLNMYKEGKKFILCCLSADVKGLFEITKLNAIFETYKTLESAIESIKEN